MLLCYVVFDFLDRKSDCSVVISGVARIWLLGRVGAAGSGHLRGGVCGGVFHPDHGRGLRWRELCLIPRKFSDFVCVKMKCFGAFLHYFQ